MFPITVPVFPPPCELDLNPAIERFRNFGHNTEFGRSKLNGLSMEIESVLIEMALVDPLQTETFSYETLTKN